MAFHHRHLPTFTRFTKIIVWKWMHLYFPMMIHYLTDKYEGRLHHLIVDTIYAVVSFLLLAANVGLGIWFYFYFTPADFELRMNVDASIKSGEHTTVHVQYANEGRRVKDAVLRVYLPDGFITGAETEGDTSHEIVEFSLGDLPQGAQGSLELPGIVYGNIKEVYIISAEATYITLGRTETVRTGDRFFINDSAFEIQIETPKASAYNLPTTVFVHYENTGSGGFDSGKIHIDFPDYFSVQSVEVNGITQNVSGDTRDFFLNTIAPHEKGTIAITGIFRGDVRYVGDQDVQITIRPFLSVYQKRSQKSVEFEYKSFSVFIRVIEPYVSLSVSGDASEVYGNTVDYRVSVRNTSSIPIERIQLNGFVSGRPLLTFSTRINGVRSGSSGYLSFPQIDRLEPGEQRVLTVSIPTQYIDTPDQISSIRVYGEAYAPLIESGFDLYSSSFSTRFASRMSIAAAALYTGPKGEQLGYGPNPPQAWNITAYRVFLRVDNGNQTVSDVTVRTTLPGMTTWTGSYSTSTGTLRYDAATRTVTWTIPSLPADAKNLGAQFEVRFLPNHLQVGLRPHIINDIFASAFDPFARMTTRASHASVSSEPILP